MRFICLRSSVQFSGIVGGSKLHCMCVYILYDHPAISLGDRPVQSLQRACRGDRMETAQSSCNLQTSTQKMHDARAMSLMTPYDYLKGLRSFLGLSKILHFQTISVWCPYGDRVIYLPCVYYLYKLAICKICHNADLNKMVEPTMPMNPYDDHTIS